MKQSIKKDITGLLRVCQNCSKEYSLEEGFRYSIRYDCYQHICKKCISKKEKEKRQEEKLIKKIVPIIKHKTCIICNNEKDISQFYFHKGSNYYLNTCINCFNKKRRDKYEQVSLGIYIERKNKRREQNKTKIDQIALVLQHCKTFDKKKKFSDKIVSIEFISKALDKPCFYCDYPSTGLDRLNNNLGHSEENCIPCCKDCNIARGNRFSPDEMVIIGNAIKEVKDNRK